MRVVISGLHAGPNPSPGVGLARSVRAAFPNAEILGVDYSDRNTGLHIPELDSVEIERSWNQIEPGQYSRHIEGLLSKGYFWLSGLDLEIWWMASVGLNRNPGVLSPSLNALKMTTKPCVQLSADGVFRVPEVVSADSADTELHAFLRRHDWRAWIKGSRYDAIRVSQWADLQDARLHLSSRWGANGLYLQEDVHGHEECIAMAAYEGQLLGAVHIEKHGITSEGKTWSGKCREVAPEVLEWIEGKVHEMRWTGGAEIEIIRDREGQAHIIEWNPRFPAWIYGAALCGRNLPALLLQAASGKTAAPAESHGDSFARIVSEIPCAPEHPLPSIRPLGEPRCNASAKAPSGAVELAGQLEVGGGPDVVEYPTYLPCVEKARVRPELLDALTQVWSSRKADAVTPERILLTDFARDEFQRAADAARALSSDTFRIAIAYSMKTNPDRRLLKLAHDCGLAIEVISSEEASVAALAGFSTSDIVMNGPKMGDPVSRETAMSMWFVDHVDELEFALGKMSEQRSAGVKPVLGLRLRPPRLDSRFGIELERFEHFARCCQILREGEGDFALGIHMHAPSHAVGLREWFGFFDSLLNWGRSIERVTGRHVEVADLGGGWFPDEWRDTLLPRLPEIVDQCRSTLGHLQIAYLEPGRALAQESSALFCRVMQVRKVGSSRELVVDASVAEIPNAKGFPHRVLYGGKDGSLKVAGVGEDIIFGRLCMEEDVLAMRLDMDVEPGDFIAFLDVGAYDSSMSYDFGRGVSRGYP